MAKPECRTAGYKLLGDYVFSEIIPEMIRDGRWDMVGTSARAARSALQLSREEAFISSEQLQTLEADLSLLESAADKKDEKPARQAFDAFFRDYGTVIIDAIAECECKNLDLGRKIERARLVWPSKTHLKTDEEVAAMLASGEIELLPWV